MAQDKDGEPSVEDILRSIKKVISRDDDRFRSARPLTSRRDEPPLPAAPAQSGGPQPGRFSPAFSPNLPPQDSSQDTYSQEGFARPGAAGSPEYHSGGTRETEGRPEYSPSGLDEPAYDLAADDDDTVYDLGQLSDGAAAGSAADAEPNHWSAGIAESNHHAAQDDDEAEHETPSEAFRAPMDEAAGGALAVDAGDALSSAQASGPSDALGEWERRERDDEAEGRSAAATRPVSAPEPSPPEPASQAAAVNPERAAPTPQPQPQPRPEPQLQPGGTEAETLIADSTAEAMRKSLASLKGATRQESAAAVVSPLEDMLRDMLRPMLRDWLDEHLPDLIEAMVEKEIARISGRL